ncbi:hypothetical protein ACJX0J_008891, partial [Zea mays]
DCQFWVALLGSTRKGQNVYMWIRVIALVEFSVFVLNDVPFLVTPSGDDASRKK